jgi:hypothetical protein
VAYPHEPLRQHMQQEAAEKLFVRQFIDELPIDKLVQHA